MIETLKPYSEMKASKVKWLGEVPEHWEVRKLRHLLRRRTERNQPELPLLSIVREQGVILRDRLSSDENHNFIPDDLSNYKVVHAGQFAMNKMKAWQGSYGVSRHEGIVSPAYFVFDLAGVDGNFFHTAIRSSAYVPAFTCASDGVRIGQWDLAEARMREIPFLVPSLLEQTCIVRFLDHADRKIRRYIRAKQKLIKLLEEQTQAIIHRAVTRGLDASVPLKDSGVPWLGEIPEHWEVRQVRRLASFVTSGSRGWADYYSDSGLVFIQSGNLGRNMALNFHYIQHVQPPSGSEGERTRVQTDDLLICITGALTGNVVHVDVALPSPSFVNQHVALVRVRPSVVEPRFLAFTLRSGIGQSQLKTSEYGGTKQGLGLGDVKDVYSPLPPCDEQQRIVVHLDATLAFFNTAITRLEREINLLHEYRSRLIADVVTGKLDVREAAVQLPDDEHEPHHLDEVYEISDPEEEDLDALDEAPEDPEP